MLSPPTQLLSIGDNAINLPLLVSQLKTRMGLVPFVGAGMSVPLGFPQWRAFLEQAAPDASIRQQVTDLLNRGQYEEAAEAVVAMRGENSFHALLEHTFGAHRLPDSFPAAAILHLPRICTGPVLTTNFDPVLEKVFDDAGRPFVRRVLGMKIDVIREAFHRTDRVLIKLHGDAADRTDRVLTWADYERAYGEREPLTAILRFAMTRPLLFLGCSLLLDRTVRVLETLASELRGRRAEGLLVHYALLEQPALESDLMARQRRLSELGIRAVWYPTGRHDLIADVLAYVATEDKHTVHGAVPQQPLHYLLRDTEIAELRDQLLAEDTTCVGVTALAGAIGVQGMGGIGKTVLAAAITREPAIREAFSDGIFWLTVGQSPNVFGLMNQLSSWLPDRSLPLTSEGDAQTALRQALAGKRVLIVLDDVWHLDHATALNLVSGPGRLFVTTRNREVLVALGAREFRVGTLSVEEALTLLANWAGVSHVALLPSEAREVADECACLPLALAMIGAMVRLRPSAWSDALEFIRSRDLEEFRRAFPDYPYPDLLRAIAVSVNELQDEDRERYLDLAVFAEDEPIPEAPLRLLWGLTAAKTRACMDRLAGRSLATFQEGEGNARLVLHDLQVDFIQKQREGQHGSLHARLLDAYGRGCHAGWASGPNDGYFFQRLAWHLQQAGRHAELRSLLVDVGWLQAKLGATDVTGLLGDYAYVHRDSDLDLVQRAIRLSSQAIREDPAILRPHLYARLSGLTGETLRALLSQIEQAPTPWLRPSTPNLTQPGLPLTHTVSGRGRIGALALTADDQRAVSLHGQFDTELRVWNVSTGEELRRLSANYFGPMTLTADGTRLVVRRRGLFRVVDLRTGEETGTLPGSGWKFATISPDAKLVAADHEEHFCLGVWSLETNELIHKLPDHKTALTTALFTADGRHVISASTDRTVMIWDIASGRPVRTLRGHDGHVDDLQISHDNRTLVSYSNGVIHVWRVASGDLMLTIQGEPPMRVSACGRFLVAITDRHKYTFGTWDLESGRLLQTMKGHESYLEALVLSAAGHRAFSAGLDQTIRVWNFLTGDHLGTLRGHSDTVNHLCLAAEGKTLLSGSDDGTVKVWDVGTQFNIPMWQGHKQRVTALRICEESRVLLSTSFDGELKRWNLGNFAELQSDRVGWGHWNTHAALTPHGTRLACVTGFEKSVIVYDTSSSATPYDFWEHRGEPIWSVAISADGNIVAFVDADMQLEIWRVGQGRVYALDTGVDARSIALSHDGRLCLFGAPEGKLRLLDVASGWHKPAFEGHASRVTAICLCDSDRLALSGSADADLRLWELDTGREVGSLGGHVNPVTTITVSPDSRRAASIDTNGLLIYWDLTERRKIASFAGDSRLSACALASDNRTVVVGEESGRIHFLELVA